jgi:trans-aconitate methyltransferase
MDIKRLYNDKLKKFGENDFRSLNWGDKEGKSAKKRYEQMAQYVDFKKSKVYEYGCGWGSFFDFGFTCKKYSGYDINENFISIAKKKYPKHIWSSESNVTWESRNAFNVCISSGVAGNRGGPAWLPSKLRSYLHQMFHLSSDLILINFPSNRSTIRTEHVEYYSPEYILGQALELTEKVQLIHQPKSDFLLIMKHE